VALVLPACEAHGAVARINLAGDRSPASAPQWQRTTRLDAPRRVALPASTHTLALQRT
jgi:hypothetical protein